jgi:metallo-beta-lactamase class B
LFYSLKHYIYSMRSIIVTLMATFLFNGSFAQPPKLEIRPLSDSFYVYTTYKLLNGKPFPANSMYVVTSAGVVMIDVPWDSTQTLPLLDSIEARHHKKVVMSISTHYHDDRTEGLDVLKQKGIKTFSTALTYELGKKENEELAEYLLSNDTTFTIGNTTFETYYPGAGHTKDNIVVWFPQQKVLYGGCFVKSTDAKDLGYTGDANVKEWPAAVKRVMEKFIAPKYIIPGHFSWKNNKSLEHTLKLLKRK